MREVLQLWRSDGRGGWKIPLFEQLRRSDRLAGKRSTPYAPGSLHDFMHAKLIVCDDVVLTGSYNCSHSGEMNAENLLEIRNRPFADECARFVEAVFARYYHA
jgi:phosphatidylserine/phosphatidylglycerophosphate/cardiolipin synthase-like enzyme